MKRKRVVLADCHSRSGLAVLRSLSRYGCGVTAVAASSKNLVAKSRRLESFRIGPDAKYYPREFSELIAATALEYEVALVIPITDAAVAALDDHRQCFAGKGVLALPPADSIRKVLDKRLNLRIAKECGVPCPREFDLRSPSQVQEMIESLGFPIVVKNPTPDDRTVTRQLPFRVALPRNETELFRVLEAVEKADVQPVFQEFVDGRSISVCLFAVEGELCAAHSYVSERRTLHQGIAREVIPLDKELESYVRKLVSGIRWTGVAHMQFLVNPDTGKCGYMETNGRFWASTQGSINAGWDFPLWFYRYFADGVRPSITPIQVGSRTVHRRADIEQLLKYLIRGPAYQSAHRSKWSACRATLRDMSPSAHSDVWSWSDIRPGIYDVMGLFSAENFKKLRKQKTGRQSER